MKKGINGWTFPAGMPATDAAEAARAAGFEAFEPVLAAERELTASTDETTCRALGDRIRQTGIEVSSLACGLFWQVPFTSPDPQIRFRARRLAIAWTGAVAGGTGPAGRSRRGGPVERTRAGRPVRGRNAVCLR